jgi:hypothetical protein
MIRVERAKKQFRRYSSAQTVPPETAGYEIAPLQLARNDKQ